MEGRGTTSYATDKPTYGFSTATTEFDDALISRGIVSFEQAMIAKGASPQEARRLAILKEGGDGSKILCDRDYDEKIKIKAQKESVKKVGDGYDYSDEDDTDDENDEEFLKKYRQMRINEMKRKYQRYGEVIHISRPDWKREVNEASKNGLWVIVNLTRSSSSLSRRHDEVCDSVEEAVRELAELFDEVKFVSIASTSAIENWPVENLPSLFCYRFGKLQHQMIGAEAFGGPGVNKGRLEWRLAALSILRTDLEEDPKPDLYERTSHSAIHGPNGCKISSDFGGFMTRLATARESNDYDDVD
mmetsp:Transcript_19614/g.41117  ORF Transcript_19614/g.41117 Transcript_19614/m.41117 type:complete len:302 (-) Transcript_19614:292-1197(-)